MRDQADLARIDRFMKALGARTRGRARVYLTGGATAVLHGWRSSTIDIDVRFQPESDELFRAVRDLKDKNTRRMGVSWPPHPHGARRRSYSSA